MCVCGYTNCLFCMWPSQNLQCKQDLRNLDIKFRKLVRTIVGPPCGLNWFAPWHKMEQGKKEVRNNKMAINKAQTKNKMHYPLGKDSLPKRLQYSSKAMLAKTGIKKKAIWRESMRPLALRIVQVPDSNVLRNWWWFVKPCSASRCLADREACCSVFQR